jgi:hypothetical protein
MTKIHATVLFVMVSGVSPPSIIVSWFFRSNFNAKLTSQNTHMKINKVTAKMKLGVLATATVALTLANAGAAIIFTSVAADLSNISPASAVTTVDSTTDNLWRQRDGFGEGDVTVLEAKEAETVATLTMTISGLSSGQSYDVYVNYIEFGNVPGAQGISASLDNNVTFLDFGAVGGAAGTPGFAELSGHTDADRSGLRGYLGTAIASGVGEIEFFANNSGIGVDYVTTAWLDGGSVAAVPEPSSAALLGLGGLALILRRRK